MPGTKSEIGYLPAYTVDFTISSADISSVTFYDVNHPILAPVSVRLPTLPTYMRYIAQRGRINGERRVARSHLLSRDARLDSEANQHRPNPRGAPLCMNLGFPCTPTAFFNARMVSIAAARPRATARIWVCAGNAPIHSTVDMIRHGKDARTSSLYTNHWLERLDDAHGCLCSFWDDRSRQQSRDTC